MEFRKVLALRGPNIWSNSPVLEAWVDLGELDRPSTDFPGFNDRLMAWMPTMIEHRCSIGERGGFFQRLRQGTYPGHILEHVTLELQSLAGSRSVSAGPARPPRRASTAWSSSTSRRRWRGSAWRWPGVVLAAVYDRPFDVQGRGAEAARAWPRRSVWGRAPAPSSRPPRPAASPHRRLNTNSLVQLGHGSGSVASRRPRPTAPAPSPRRSRRTRNSPACCLRAVGVPVPDGRPVADADDAWEAAEEIGAPVVVKPRDGNQGRGVATNLTTREQVTGRLRGRPPRKARKRSWWSSSPPAMTIACWSSADGSWPRPAASRPRSLATAPTRSGADRRGQRRSPPRRASCHGAEQDQAGRRVAGRAGRAGADARLGAGGRRDRADPPQRAISAPAAPPST